MNSIIRILVSIIILQTLTAGEGVSQTSQTNLNKYWKYRERLKNFVIPGFDYGLSMPAIERDAGNTLYWNDAGIHLGYYIAMLATEYSALLNCANCQPQALQRTKEELFYAIDAINRLDHCAEYWWKFYYIPQNTDCFLNDINGFQIRDDITNELPENSLQTDFVNHSRNGELYENLLNSSLVPPLDGRKAKGISSAFQSGISLVGAGFTGSCSFLNGKHSGPEEMTFDQIVQLMYGLAMVTKCVPFGENYNNMVFRDGLTSDFNTEVKYITKRWSDWFQSNGWTIVNPVTNSCIKGVHWDNHDQNATGCKCDPGGGNIGSLFAYGFARAASYIINPTNPGQYYNIFYSNDATVNITSRFIWNNIIYITPNQEDDKFLVLAAIGKAWDFDHGLFATAAKIDVRARKTNGSELHHIPLLYQLIWGGPDFFSDSFYECLLNTAPCNGTNYFDGNYEWSQDGGRILSGSNTSGQSFSGESSGVDYMLYFNMYYLNNPGYLAGTYRDIVPGDLCSNTVSKFNYIESDKKNIRAFASIVAGNIGNQGNYIIQNDNDPKQTCSLCPCPVCARAQITFRTAHSIDLLPGFEARKGVLFDASIDAALKDMNCQASDHLTNCFNTYGFNGSGNLSAKESNQMTLGDLYRIQDTYIQLQGDRESEMAARNDQLTELVFNVLPNPSINGEFELELHPNVDYTGFRVSIINALGELIQEFGIEKIITKINISAHSKGIYFLKIYDLSGRMGFKKIIYQ